MKFIFALCLFVTSAMVPLREPCAQASVDLQLVLAIDVSSSVNYGEFDLQMRGYVAAFRSPAVKAAIESGHFGRIRVALMQWAGAGQQQLSLDWQDIGSAAEAEAFADKVEYVARAYDFGGTAITPALQFAQSLFARDTVTATRQVIDLSGDGRVSVGSSPQAQRNKIVAAGITINGLPILNEEPELDLYFSESVIGGQGAFIEAATDYSDFARAIETKLAREIKGVWFGM